MTDFLDEKRREITDRLKELKPAVDEYARLEAAASALAGVGGSRFRHRRDSRSSPPRTGTPAWLGQSHRRSGRRCTAAKPKRKPGRPPDAAAPDDAKAAAHARPRRSRS